ncbi:MAG: hypothetical protein WBI74_00985 [Caldicoprobacterales bacterium]|jgi:hypothetical protein
MAVINVTPLTDITALIASDTVSPGDVLLLQDGLYFQTVNITKDNIRIIAIRRYMKVANHTLCDLEKGGK